MTALRDLLRRHWRAIAAVTALVIVASALQLLHQAGLESWRSIWAEDGTEWYRAARDQGLGAFAHSHAGYLQTLSRLLAAPSPWIPIGGLAVYFAVLGAVTTTLLALAVYVLSGTWIESRVLRALLAFATMFLPVLVFENIGNVTNTIWPLTFAGFWALLYHPRTRGWAATAALIAALAALSNALAVLFVPIALVLWFRCRDPLHRAVLASYAVAVAIQGVVMVTGTGGTSAPAHHLTELYAVRVLASTLVGEKWLEQLWRDGGYTAVLPFAAVVALCVVVLLIRSRGVRRVLGATAVAYSLVFFLLPVAIRGTAAMPLIPDYWFSGGARYAGLSIWLLLSGVCVMVDSLPVDASRRAIVTIAVVAPIVIASVLGFRIQNLRSDGPDWRADLRAAGDACREPHRRAVHIVIAPAGRQLTVRVECADLR